MLDMMQQTLQRETLRFAAGTAVWCPCCGGALDAKESVLLIHGELVAIACAACYGRPAGTFKAGAVEVLDGRTLWRPTRRTWSFK